MFDARSICRSQLFKDNMKIISLGINDNNLNESVYLFTIDTF